MLFPGKMEENPIPPRNPHSKLKSPWVGILHDKLKCFRNRINNLNLSVNVETHLKPTRGSFKAYVWLVRDTYAPVKLKVRIRYDIDIQLLDKMLTGIFDSLKPENYIDQNDISTEVCSSSPSSGCSSPDVFAHSDFH